MSESGQLEPASELVEVLLIDNYDSFTWNVYQYLCQIKANVSVVRSQSLTLDEIVATYNPSHLVISPGPGHPLQDSGVSIPLIKHYAGKIPILGICMGLQCIYAAYDGVVDNAGEIIHGKTSQLEHDGKGLFKGLPQGIRATRYHSLASSLSSLPQALEISSRTMPDSDGQKGGIIMGVRHNLYVIEGIQYHPESILSEEGQAMLKNFLKLRGGLWSQNIDALGSSLRATKLNNSALPTILTRIANQRTADVDKSKSHPSTSAFELETRISMGLAPPAVDLYERLKTRSPSVQDSDVALMAEIKRASPSKGNIVSPSTSFSSAPVALSFALAGASVISVLTEPTWFKGSLEDMRAARSVIADLPYRPAILRKDFILDTYQIDEARLYGADTVLLIVAMLDHDQLTKLFNHSRLRGMEPLVEVNNAEELDRALALGSKVIGVNNRNLHDFAVDMSTTSRLAQVIQEKRQNSEEVILCALSGISSRDDVVRYTGQGVSAILVGESLMRADDRDAFAKELLGITPHGQTNVTNGDSVPASEKRRTEPIVKICGVKTPEVALAAADNGTDFIGLMFVPKSKRYVDPETAEKIIQSVRENYGTTSMSDSPVRLEHGDDAQDWFELQSLRLRSRRPLFVGVFQNAPIAHVIEMVERLRLDVVQLHGNEPWEWCRLVGVPVIKAFTFPRAEENDKEGKSDEANGVKDHDETVAGPAALSSVRPGYHAMSLFDTATSHSKALSGGAGKTFDWTLATRVSNLPRGEGLGPLPFILAGGLDVANVKAALAATSAWGVDVSGGVEIDGEKDIDKIVAFIKTVKES